MSSASVKRPAPTAKPPSAKRQDTGANKDQADTITPAKAPGSYRLVEGLKPQHTESDVYTSWPGIWLDDEMVRLLLAGKKKPKSAQEAVDYPGHFLPGVKVTANTAVIPILLIGDEKEYPMWVPTTRLKLMKRSGMRVVIDTEEAPSKLKEAYELVLEGKGLDYWKRKLKLDVAGDKGGEFDHGEEMDLGGNGDSASDDEADATYAASQVMAQRSLSQLRKSTEDSTYTQSTDTIMASPGVENISAGLANGHRDPRQSESRTVTDTIEAASGQNTATGSTQPSTASQITKSDIVATGNTKTLTKTDDIDMGDAAAPIDEPRTVKGEDGDVDMKDGIGTLESIETEPKRPFEMTPQERAQIRLNNAGRKAVYKEEVRVSLGPDDGVFIVKRSSLKQSSYLNGKLEYDADDDQEHLVAHKLRGIKPEQFDPVAEFLNSGDYEPVIVRTNAGKRILKDFDTKDSKLAQTLARQSVNLHKIASDLELPKLATLAVETFKLLSPYRPSDFLNFLSDMEAKNYCDDKDLKHWLMEYAASHLYELLEGEKKFRVFMETRPDVEKMVFRIKAGFPAEEHVETPTPKKRTSRKKKDTAADAKDPESQKAGPAKKPTAAESKKAAAAPKTPATPKAGAGKGATKKGEDTPGAPKTPGRKAGKTSTAKSKEHESDDDGYEYDVKPTKPTPAKQAGTAKPRGRNSAAATETKAKATKPKAAAAKKAEVKKTGTAAAKNARLTPVQDSEDDGSDSDSEDGSEIAASRTPKETATKDDEKEPAPSANKPKANSATPKPVVTNKTGTPAPTGRKKPGPKPGAKAKSTEPDAKPAPKSARGKKTTPASPSLTSDTRIAVMVPPTPVGMTQTLFNKKPAEEKNSMPPPTKPAAVKRGSRPSTPKSVPENTVDSLAATSRDVDTAMADVPKTPGAVGSQGGTAQTTPTIALGDEIVDEEEGNNESSSDEEGEESDEEGDENEEAK